MALETTDNTSKARSGRKSRLERVCALCNSKDSCLWRRYENGWICNKCGCKLRRQRVRSQLANAPAPKPPQEEPPLQQPQPQPQPSHLSSYGSGLATCLPGRVVLPYRLPAVVNLNTAQMLYALLPVGPGCPTLTASDGSSLHLLQHQRQLSGMPSVAFTSMGGIDSPTLPTPVDTGIADPGVSPLAAGAGAARPLQQQQRQQQQPEHRGQLQQALPAVPAVRLQPQSQPDATNIQRSASSAQALGLAPLQQASVALPALSRPSRQAEHCAMMMLQACTPGVMAQPIVSLPSLGEPLQTACSAVPLPALPPEQPSLPCGSPAAARPSRQA